MTDALFLVVALFAGICIGAVSIRYRFRRFKREQFIRGYVFPRALLETLSKIYPTLDDKDTFLVARALRTFFLAHVRAPNEMLGMPSKVVDALWHEFILDTRAYHAFCMQAFGSYFHHIPTRKMTQGMSSDAALRRIWRLSCLEENINPKAATRLPLLFAIDSKFQIPDGNHYNLKSQENPQAGNSCGGGCSGFACSGGGLACSDGDSSCCGDSGGCGGGCGGD